MALQKDDPKQLPTPLTPQALMQDPAYKAFLRTSGIQEQLDLANQIEKENRIQRVRELRLQGSEESGEEARETISGQQESAGVLSSGQTLERMARQERGQMRQQALIGMESDDQLQDLRTAGLEASLGRTVRGGELLAGLAGQRAEELGESEFQDPGLASLSSTVPGLSALQPVSAESVARSKPIADVGISTKKRQPILGGYKRDF